MKKLYFLAISVFALASCSHDFGDYDERELLYPTLTKEQIDQNVEKVFGTTFDPNHDWMTTTSRTVNITANADLNDIVKVQILTESPYFNSEARVLSEASVAKGETVSLTFDAPQSATRLIAACVNSEGVYFTKGFDVSSSTISFQSSSRAATRASADSYNFPDKSKFYIDTQNSFLSYNAIRTYFSKKGINSNIDIWYGSNWENERLWKVSGNGANGWEMKNNTIRKQIANDFTSEEKQNLQDIFSAFLYWDNNNTHKDNLPLIRNSALVKLYNNQLEANGEPVIITPIQATSTDIKLSDLYYYYYNPEDIQGLSEDQQIKYIKDLPKFKAIQGGDVKTGSSEFYRNHEYILPYYGDNLEIDITKLYSSISGYTIDDKVYRIYNGYLDNGKYYMKYNSDENNRLTNNDSDILMQLWQIIKSDDGNSCYLFNIGAHCFFHYSGNWNTSFTQAEYVDGNCKPFKLKIDSVYQFLRDESKKLGSDLFNNKNKGIWSDKNTNNGTCDWYLEPYEGSIDSDLKLKQLSKTNNYKVTNVIDYAIPAGYKIGFMLRKRGGDAHTESYTIKNIGEVYADGRLNTLINQYPDFRSAANGYFGHMNIDDPRMAIFSANNKTYMTFEDGTDCNFADMIIEISNGINNIDETQEIFRGVYTFCFEDRQDGDYDMNDVVIKAQRIDLTHVKYSLEACGANDELYLRGINGSVLNDFVEIHKLFNVNLSTFVNTTNSVRKDPISETIEVSSDFSFTDLPNQIYIYNATTGKDIKLSNAGEDPHGLLIPYDYQYPLERECIKDANPEFIDWGKNPISSNSSWYKNNVEGKVYTESTFK